MERDASLELLNATHDFPCDFTLKVIGSAANDFEQRVVTVVATALRVSDVPYSVRATPNKRHVALTLEPKLQSAEQVLLLYERLKSVDGVVMTM